MIRLMKFMGPKSSVRSNQEKCARSFEERGYKTSITDYEVYDDFTGHGFVEVDSKILNLTLRKATKEQIADGVIDPTDADKLAIRKAIDKCKKLAKLDHDFVSMKSMNDAAAIIADIASEHYDVLFAMLSGPAWLIPALEKDLYHKGIIPVYSLSERKGGSIRHTGWIKKQYIYTI